MPVPEYWIELTLPIAVCAACRTLVVVRGVLQPATPRTKPANSHSFLAICLLLSKNVQPNTVE